MQGAIIRSYKSGSIIYFEGDRGDNVYVLQTGAIRLLYGSLDGQEEVREEVKKGEFFGVKSSLAHYPREETAQVLVDSTVLIFDVQGFQNLCLNNVRLVLQMLKVFSSQLRRVHKQVREQLGEVGSLETSVEFLRVGEYYYKHGHINQAKYILGKFMEHYSDSEIYERAVKLQRLIDSGQPYPEDIASLSPSASNEQSTGSQNQESMGNTSAQGSGNSSEANKEGQAGGVAEKFYSGLNLISSNLGVAIQTFEEIMQTQHLTGFAEASILEKAHFELSRCYLKQGNFPKTIQLVSDFLRKYPNSAQAKKVLIVLAEAFEGEGNPNKAIALYAKVVNLPPRDPDSQLANKKLKKLRDKK